MFGDPSLEDFSARIDHCLHTAYAACGKSVGSIKVESAAKGRYQSGYTITKIFDNARENLDSGVSLALAELHRIAGLNKLDRWELRRITHERLERFVSRIKAVINPDQLKQFGPARIIDQRLAELDRRLAFALRQFDVGFEDPPVNQESKVMQNSIQIQTNLGNVQQATSASSQTQRLKVDLASARSLAAALDAELSISGREFAELRAEVATIKAQLQKKEPNASILYEAGRSMRAIGEGIVSGALTNRAVQLLGDLGRSLGLG